MKENSKEPSFTLIGLEILHLHELLHILYLTWGYLLQQQQLFLKYVFRVQNPLLRVLTTILNTKLKTV